MNVLSLFDGIACGRVAIDRAGIKVDNYYASEIDKYAIQIAKKNYPDIIEIGDVNTLDLSKLPKIDLLIGGSPCQGFSNAGKRLNFNDPRSKLFFKYVEILKAVKPKYFLLENVKMKQEWQDIISEQLGVKPVMINSALVSAQNRKRCYWADFEIPQPEDKHIYLRDILEPKVDEKYFVKLKSNTIRSGGRGSGIGDRHNWGTIRIGDIGSTAQAQRVYSAQGKSVTLSSLGGGQGAKTGLYAVAQRGRYLVDGKRKDVLHAPTEQRFETSFSEKNNCLTSVQKDSLALQHGQIRKLTPLECERLQTMPDNYTAGVSDSQRYKMLGNGWTVDVIAHIFRQLNKKGE